ncbi:MAG: NAD(P)-dependent dehydrogenase (short-subunit alcohol dehydrogenase family) [Gammaproteobacteria bacterium]|jgi:NAD(P)-dependent dehydrogenase (short-subunit alcohol dehydrogenase family)
MKDFEGKTAVITGGATGIGLALARQLGAAGARLIIFEPREERLIGAVSELQDAGYDAQYVIGDVTKLEDVERLADFAWANNGRADILLNNAGVSSPRKSVINTDPEEARRVFDVNFFGVWSGISVFGKRFLADGLPSAIYTVASENSLFNALPFGNGAYLSTKHAVFGLMDVLRREAHPNIQLGVIFPGWVLSEMSDYGKDIAMDTDEFAAIIFKQMQAGEYYLVSHAYNAVRLEERQNEILSAFAKYAPRYEGDDEYDVQTVVERMQKGE